jgi:predicted GIY-YIG superfamily endonuclease
MINAMEREQKKVKGLIGSCKTANQITMGNQQRKSSLFLNKAKRSTTKVFLSLGRKQRTSNCFVIIVGRRYSLTFGETQSSLKTMQKLFTLYKITTPDGFFYIGVTSNLEERISSHCKQSAQFKSAIGAKILEWGKDRLKVEVIKQFTDLSQALQAEALIADPTDPYCLNIIKGGGQPPSYGQTKKPIKIDGIVYPSIQEASSALGLTRHQLDRLIKLDKIDFEFMPKTTLNLKGKKQSVKKQVMFDGKAYNSYKEVCSLFNLSKDEYIKARKHFGRDHITLEEVQSLRIGKKTTIVNGLEYSSRRKAIESGQITSYELYKRINKKKTSPSKVSVGQIDIESGMTIETYSSLSEAAKSIGAKTSSKICQCCRGQRNTAYGYKWVYLSDPRVAN